MPTIQRFVLVMVGGVGWIRASTRFGKKTSAGNAVNAKFYSSKGDRLGVSKLYDASGAHLGARFF